MQIDPGTEYISFIPMETPAILLLVFNRPDFTGRVLEVIRKAQPKRLYISSDGADANNTDEQALVKNVRKVIDSIDWDCELKTIFRKNNLGCRVAVSSAIDWFFEYEEEGIILEDDCLPDLSFFRYCAELLKYYRDDTRIMCLSGDNFQQGRSVTNNSYYFSKYNHCWGWATWRRAWVHYDRDMTYWADFRDNGGLKALSEGSDAFIQYWEKIFNMAAAGTIDSWAYRWTFSCWSQNGLTCLPNRNLVKNIGFDNQATHTKGGVGWRENIEAEEIVFPLYHPKYMIRNVDADIFSDRVYFEIQDNSSYGIPNGIYIKNLSSRFLKGIHTTLLKVLKL